MYVHYVYLIDHHPIGAFHDQNEWMNKWMNTHSILKSQLAGGRPVGYKQSAAKGVEFRAIANKYRE